MSIANFEQETDRRSIAPVFNYPVISHSHLRQWTELGPSWTPIRLNLTPGRVPARAEASCDHVLFLTWPARAQQRVNQSH